ILNLVISTPNSVGIPRSI
ncbi:unnamed protein product, partial [Allacma fusca]